jgi:mRNA interferase YafQ
MRYEIDYTHTFKKDYKRIVKRNYDVKLLFRLIEQLIESGVVDALYKPHKLRGKYSGYWECHIQSDWLLIWEVKEQEKSILLHFTGTHADLF